MVKPRKSPFGDLVPLLSAVLLASGCAGPVRGPAVPVDLQDRAVVMGLAGIRTWGDDIHPDFGDEIQEALRREQAYLTETGHQGPLARADFLAISGGGANGAYGAGLLCGWTQAGDRPQFKAVTGISTGALIAPFAFIGSDQDQTLRTFYTGITTRDVLSRRSLLAAAFDDALADNGPLRELLNRCIDQKMLLAIAAEHAKGRILLIGTTNLDARRGVIWNVTAIAASGHPRALDLIREIMIASAAIPAAFPPVMFDVEAGGHRYQELHVDGGVMTQVFLYPPSFRLAEDARVLGVTRERRLYVIRNARLDPDWAETKRRTLPIAGRAIDALIQTQGIGDLYRIYLSAQRDGIEFNVAYIPATFNGVPREAFDREYMTRLFETGYEMAVKGYPWEKTPPGYKPASSG